MKKIAIIFEGNIKSDARVLREVDSYSYDHEVDIYSSEVEVNDLEVLPKNTRLFSYEIRSNWANDNLFFCNRHKDLLELINPFDYDILICDNYPFLKIGVLLKKKNPKLTVIYDSREYYVETINQFFPTKGIKQFYGRPLIVINKFLHFYLEKSLVQKIDHCVTVCQSISIILSKKWNKKVHLLRNVPSLHHIENQMISDELLCFDPNDFLLLYQGNLNPGRGLELMMEVMKYVPTNFQFLVLGDGMLSIELKKIKERFKLNNVHFINKVPYNQLLQITKRANLGISLIEPINESKRLSLPNKLFEYMSVGVPFISNDLPEPNFLIDKYKCGIIIDSSNVQNVVLKLKELDMNQLSVLGQNGLKAFKSELNWETEFERFRLSINLN